MDSSDCPSVSLILKWLRSDSWVVGGCFSFYCLYVQLQSRHIFLAYSVVSFLNIPLCLLFVPSPILLISLFCCN